jgi:hypothetical protein
METYFVPKYGTWHRIPSRRGRVVRFRVWDTSFLVTLTADYIRMQPYFVPGYLDRLLPRQALF